MCGRSQQVSVAWAGPESVITCTVRWSHAVDVSMHFFTAEITCFVVSKHPTNTPTLHPAAVPSCMCTMQGFPRSDIDVAAVRSDRQAIIRLTNDHKALSGQLEQLLHKVHALARWGWAGVWFLLGIEAFVSGLFMVNCPPRQVQVRENTHQGPGK